jgi:hypothetical protein
MVGEDGWFTLGKGFGIFLNNPTQSVFFFKRILWCSRQGGDHSENVFSQIWLHARHESRKRIESFYIYIYMYIYILGYLVELIIKIWGFEIFWFQNLANLGDLFCEKSFVYRSSKPYFSGWNLVNLSLFYRISPCHATKILVYKRGLTSCKNNN